MTSAIGATRVPRRRAAIPNCARQLRRREIGYLGEMVRLLRVVSCVVAMLAAVWTLRLVLVGGITVVVSGLRIRSNDPIRPVEIIIGALVVFALTGGVRSVLGVWRKVSASAPRLPFVRSVHAAPATAAVLAALVCAAGLVRGT